MPIHDYVRMARLMQRLNKPVVASVQGGVAGAALGLISACDLVIAADTAFFWAAHILHGGSNDGLVSYFLPRQIGLRRALEMCLLGERIKAPQAKEIGLIGHVVPDGSTLDKALEIAEMIGANAPLAVEAVKRSVGETEGMSEVDGLARELEIGWPVFATEDAKEGPRAFAEKRPANFQRR